MPYLSPWPLSAFITSLPGDFRAALTQIASLGFSHVDIVAAVERSEEEWGALADSGLIVCCASLGRDLPPGHTLDAPDVGVRRATLQALKRQVSDAAQLGATTAYLIPGMESGEAALTAFAEGCALLADYAAERMVRLCVEHIPGRALPTAAGTLDWLEQVGHPRLSLLLDVGHCLISQEDAAAIVRRAGSRLGYVHLDDNDGVGDLHWPLLTGRLSEKQLTDLLATLQESGYQAALSLELNPGNPDPTRALREGKAIVDRLLGAALAT
jgi:sugar phosphate isomerase/epimerase